MSGAYGFSAADSVTGAIYAWTLATVDFSGAGYPGPNSPVNQRLVATSNQGPAGNNGAATPVAVMIDGSVPGGNVANLSAGPTAWAGYTLLVNDVVGMSNQTTTANNRLYTYTSSGVFTPLATQPPDNTTIITLKGANPYQVFYYQPNLISSLNVVNLATVVGTNTTLTLAPDALGLPNIANEGDGRITIPTGAAWTTVWTCDPVGRGFTTGRVLVTAEFLIVDGPNGTSVLVKGIFNCAAATLACQKNADVTDDGSGPYINGRLIVVGGVLCAQLSNLTGSDFHAVGISAFFRGTP